VDTLQLDEVTVTGIRPPEKDRSVIPMQTVTRREMDLLSGSTAADALKNFSGITLKDYGGLGGLKTVMVRSLGANHTAIFVDGIHFSDAATGQVDLGKIATGDIDEISLYIGQPLQPCQPARFFSSASVINIKSPVSGYHDNPLTVKAGYKTGSFGLINPVISVHSKFRNNLSSDFSGNYIKAFGEYPFRIHYGNSQDTLAIRENSDIESINLNSSIVATLKDSSILSAKVYYYGSERGLPGAVVFYNPFATQRLWNRDFFSNIRFESGSGKTLQWLTNIKYSRNSLRYLDPEYLNAEGKLDNRYIQNEYYFSQSVSRELIDSLQMSIASDFFINTLDANLFEYARPTRFSSLSVVALQYLRPEWEISGSMLATLVQEKTTNGEPAHGRKILTPSLSLGFKLLSRPNIRLRFLYKDIFRMPTFNDLYYTLVGNNNLEPEYAKQYNLGITAYYSFKFIEYLSFKADFYFNKVEDKIVAVPTKNLFVWSMLNIGEVNVRGMEFQTQFRVQPVTHTYLSLISNYTLQNAWDVTLPGSDTYQQQIPYIPVETFSALLSLRHKSLTMGYNSMFNGFRYVLGENTYENMIPSYWISDMTLMYDIQMKKHNLNVKGEVRNLYNTQYEVIRGFPMPGRAYYLTMTFTL